MTKHRVSIQCRGLRLGSKDLRTISHLTFPKAEPVKPFSHTCLLLAHSLKNSLPSNLHVSSST